MSDTETTSTTNISSALGNIILTVIDKLLEGFQLIDENWRYVYVNDTVAKQGKREKKELVGKTMMECFPGIENTPLFKQLERCKSEQVNIEMENEFVYPDKSTSWFQLLIHPWEKGVLIFSMDITDRKLAEKQLSIHIKKLNIIVEATINRELKMIELKKVVSKLRELDPVEGSTF